MKQFGIFGVVCKSPHMNCVVDVLKVSSFADRPVRPVSVKGAFRVVGSSMGAAELLEFLSALNVVGVYHCSVDKYSRRVPTKTCVIAFAGVCCSPELETWSLLFRVKFYRKPKQFRTCLRYGHGQRACKSAPSLQDVFRFPLRQCLLCL